MATMIKQDARFVRKFERLLVQRNGRQPFTEFYEREDKGECGNCGEPVILVVNSSFTVHTDRTRYRYPEDTEGWCIFRCRGCSQVIADNWRATPSEATP